MLDLGGSVDNFVAVRILCMRRVLIDEASLCFSMVVEKAGSLARKESLEDSRLTYKEVASSRVNKEMMVKGAWLDNR